MSRGYVPKERTGEKNPMAKLDDDEARRIREARRDRKLSMKDLARMFGVSATTVRFVVRGLSYTDAGGPVEEPGTYRRSKT